MPNDLDSLIQQADSQVRRREAQRPSARRSAHMPGQPVLISLLLLAIAIPMYFVWNRLSPPREDKVAHDLEHAVEEARTAIEKAKAETGQLPEALPNAALAAVVSYERGKSDYKLSATIMGIRVTLEPNGKKTMEKGVSP